MKKLPRCQSAECQSALEARKRATCQSAPNSKGRMWGAVKQPAHDPWSRLPKAQRGTTTRGTSAAPAPTGPSRSAIRVQRNRLRLKAQAAARLHPVLATLLDSIVPARPMRNHRRTRCSRSVQLPRCGLNRWPGETLGAKPTNWRRPGSGISLYSPNTVRHGRWRRPRSNSAVRAATASIPGLA